MNSFIPWVGGKGKLLWIINKLMPDRYTRFIDVFGGSGTVTNCFYLAETSTFDKKGTADDIGARTAEEFQLGRVAYELGGSSYVWVYDTTNKAEKMPQLGRSSGTMAVANELKLTKPDNQPEGVVVTLGNDSDKKTLTDALSLIHI